MDALTFIVLVQQNPHAIIDLGAKGTLAHASCLAQRRDRMLNSIHPMREALNLHNWEQYTGRVEDTFGCMFCLKPF